jgi:hypothetical protein
MYYCYYGSTTLCWALAAFSISWSYTQSVGLLGRCISPSHGLYLHVHTQQQKHRLNAHNTDIHALIGIRTHDLSVRTSEDCSCLRPRGHRDRLTKCITCIFLAESICRFPTVLTVTINYFHTQH